MKRTQKTKKATARKRPGREPLAISPTWQEWAAENLVKGASRAEVQAVLVEEGASKELAASTVLTIEASPAMRIARRLSRGSRRVVTVARLVDTLRGTVPAGRFPRVPYPGTPAFLERYWATNTPVVFNDIVASWPAMRTWTLDNLEARFGDARVDVTTGRTSDPDYDMHHERHTRSMPLREYIGMIRAAKEPTNDFYMVANNRNLQKALGELVKDVTLPSDAFRTEKLVGGAAFWLGPAGTVTPLHHDTSNILFCQVRGRKAYKMIAPTETRLLDDARAMYASVDPEAPDLERHPWWPTVRVIDDVIEPGEALFIPVGWWHHVRALDVSISLAVNAFRERNGFDWYVPGSI